MIEGPTKYFIKKFLFLLKLNVHLMPELVPVGSVFHLTSTTSGVSNSMSQVKYFSLTDW